MCRSDLWGIYVWKMPFFEGSRPLVRTVAAGWSLNGITTIQTGLNGANEDFVISARVLGQGLVATQFFRSPPPNVTHSACLAAKTEEMPVLLRKSTRRPQPKTLRQGPQVGGTGLV